MRDSQSDHNRSPLRIPLKWGTDSGEVGQRRSGATLVRAMISEVPHLSQEFCCWRGKQHHFVSIVSFLLAADPFEVGHDSAGKWGRIPGHVGHDSAEVGQPGRLPLWYLSDHFV